MRAPSPFVERLFAIWSVWGTAICAIIAGWLAWRDGGVRSVDLALFLIGLVSTGIGVSLGLHRLFSHRSFTCRRSGWTVLALLGTAAGQGYFLRWINDHRLHHQFTDQPGDPHSPHWHQGVPLAGLAGLAHAHALWLFRERAPVDAGRLHDLARDPVSVRIDRLSPAITVCGALLPGLIAWGFEPTLQSGLMGALWGGGVRMFALNHATWAVNSLGHTWGAKVDGQVGDARNNLLLALLAFGDGWHANHHCAPRSARHGWGGLQPDFNWMLLRVLLALDLVQSVTVIRPQRDPSNSAVEV